MRKVIWIEVHQIQPDISDQPASVSFRSLAVVLVAKDNHLEFDVTPWPVLEWDFPSEISVISPFVMDVDVFCAISVVDDTTLVSFENELFGSVYRVPSLL